MLKTDPGMSPPENPPSPKPADLRPAQVPWGSRKTAAPPTAPETAAPALSAKQVPWGSHRPKKPGPPPPAQDPMVTHMPWALPTTPPMPVAPAPTARSVFAKLVPWTSRKAKPAPPPPEIIPAEPSSSATTAAWALPKTSDAARAGPPVDQVEMEFARGLEGQRASAGEPTAEQLVALLSKMAARTREPRASPNAQAPYKAAPISFDATQWDVVKLYAQLHRWRLIAAGAVLLLMLGTAYLMRLVSLNAEIDREWQAVDKALLQRYAAVPSYVECILSYSAEERFTLNLTERNLTAWRTAKTDAEIAAAAPRMERVLVLLSKVMKRCEHATPAPDPDQLESSVLFAHLEEQREQSRVSTAEMIQRYNAAVNDFNDKVLGVPGTWVAWAAHLHPRSPLFASSKE